MACVTAKVLNETGPLKAKVAVPLRASSGSDLQASHDERLELFRIVALQQGLILARELAGPYIRCAKNVV